MGLVVGPWWVCDGGRQTALFVSAAHFIKRTLVSTFPVMKVSSLRIPLSLTSEENPLFSFIHSFVRSCARAFVRSLPARNVRGCWGREEEDPARWRTGETNTYTRRRSADFFVSWKVVVTATARGGRPSVREMMVVTDDRKGKNSSAWRSEFMRQGGRGEVIRA